MADDVGVAERGLIFGTVAAQYERSRPGYPPAVAEQILAYASRPLEDALEIGAGTGKATRLMAASGLRVTASEPDPAMLAELCKHVPDTVRCVRSAFEDLPLQRGYDLVYAAASLHWTRPDDRWTRVGALLRPAGVFASFGAPLRLADPSVRQAFYAVRSRYLADDDIPATDGIPVDGALQWPGTELVRCSLFTDVTQSTIVRRLSMTAAEWVAHLATLSAYLQLPAEVRRRAFDDLLAALPARLDVDADVTVHLARLR
jgi:SAM-dependent methyltransferase